ncbi:MAG: helix-turn-helix transcriptional regulator [Acidobacteriaceae bacterium]|nr:helix-turn-helix transcriptional regulator [Acidobacteriaceae bacterium]MBV9778421.1 helix-turn-helix transcriptional regulator [Acidobacteriaceae bacterium]
MEEPGQKLRRAREKLHLKYRDVEEASQRIANRRDNDEFLIRLSRLADIENKGTVPTVYRLYSLCAIYRLDFATVLRWYGIELGALAADALTTPISDTHRIELKPSDTGHIAFPAELNEHVDLRQTSYLSRHIHRWGKLPLVFTNSLDLRNHCYGFMGTEDWSMYPVIAPGSFLQVDESKRRISTEGWSHELERPIYFVEHHRGYRCGWCAMRDGRLIVQSHSTSHVLPDVFRFPGDAEIVGQVVGVAMRLDLGKRRHTRS